MDIEITNSNGYLEIIKKNIKNLTSKDFPLIIYTIIPDLKNSYYINIAKSIESSLYQYNCLFMLTDILFGTGLRQLIEKLVTIKVAMVIIIDVNHKLKEQLQENGLKAVSINC